MNRLTYLAAGALVAATSLPAVAQQQPSTVPQARIDSPRVVSRSTSSRFATIEGLAVRRGRGTSASSAVNAPGAPEGDRIPNVLVRLRDARFGRPVDTQLTDTNGAFLFRAVNPGNYMVEIVGINQSAIAATQLISANAGETVSAVVRLPEQRPSFAALLGEQSTPALTTTQAGITGLVPSGIGALPIVLVQSLPAVVAVNPASSER